LVLLGCSAYAGCDAELAQPVERLQVDDEAPVLVVLEVVDVRGDVGADEVVGDDACQDLGDGGTESLLERLVLGEAGGLASALSHGGSLPGPMARSRRVRRRGTCRDVGRGSPR